MSAEDNRKRGIVQDEIGAALARKKAALGGSQHKPSGETFFFKLLCPQPLTGIIIGRSGANLTQLTNASGVKIKLSKNDEYYPGTVDRPMLLTGDRTGLQMAVRELVIKMAESPEKRVGGGPVDPSTPACNRGSDGSYQVRLLIPRGASGVLIGKGGAIIKQMTDHSHCKMQLGDERDPYNTNERIFIINSSSVSNLASGAVEVLNMLLLQPKVREYSNPTPNYSELIQAVDGGMAAGQGMMGSQGAPPPPMQQQFNPQGQQFPGQMPVFMQMPAGGGVGTGMMMVGPNGILYPVAVAAGQAAPMMYGTPQQQQQQQQQQPMQQMQPAGNAGQQQQHQYYGPGVKTPTKAVGRKAGSTAQPKQPPVANPGSVPYGANPLQQQQQPQSQQPYNMGYMGTVMMAPGQGQQGPGQQQVMGMPPSTIPVAATGAPNTGMPMMGQSAVPQGAVPSMQQQGMYMQQQPMQNGAQMGTMGMAAVGGPSQQHQQYMAMPAAMGNPYNPQQHIQQPGSAGNAYNPQQQVAQGQQAPQQQAVYGMAYPAATATGAAEYMQQQPQQQQMGGMPMMMPMQQQPMQGQQPPMYTPQIAGMAPQQQQYGGGMYQPTPSGHNNARGGRNGKK